ncbi:hypothetical protein REC12_11480 [Desulfosporosinus sp. PR]|uniref:hypothetical protein n=1 Tax=Candidatus Desulfosporosinus nitrosoreducens TaxID=3401928 RepID=UPI0027EA4B00|nr:hypothetical protein [Desulfosporosinus sp. PR]MDQ7094210.1 hypothetical protein [Desulfosporosinus sp. PR]
MNGNVSVGVDDRTKQFLESLKSLSKVDVLVGIPEETSSREGETITNAELAFIHSKGSPLQNIPARPFVEPAIEDKENKEQIMAELSKAVEAVMSGDIEALSKALESAGMVAQNVVRDWFKNPKNGWPPDSPLTVLNKLRKDKSSIAKGIVRYVDEGGSLSDISGIEGMTHPLIDTEQLRKAVTYVVREKD